MNLGFSLVVVGENPLYTTTNEAWFLLLFFVWLVWAFLDWLWSLLQAEELFDFESGFAALY